MRRASDVAWRLAIVPAAMICLAIAPLAGQAQTAEPEGAGEVEAAPSDDAGGFTPPMFGSPDRLIGAGSRELGRGAGADDPCAASEGETEAGGETALEDCIGATEEATGEVDGTPETGGEAPAGQ